MTFVTSALGEVPELGIRRKTAPCTPPELFYKDEAVEHKYCVLDAEGLQKSKKQNVPFSAVTDATASSTSLLLRETSLILIPASPTLTTALARVPAVANP